jgi:hypothetical protein
VPLLGSPELCRTPGGSPFRTGHESSHGCFLLSLGNDSPSDLVPHSGNIHGLLLALEMLGCSSWLLGQEGEVSGCSGSTAVAVAEGTASDTVAGVIANAGAGVLEGDFP